MPSTLEGGSDAPRDPTSPPHQNFGDYLPPVQRESLGPRFQKVWAASAISLVGDGLILSAMPLLIAGLTTGSTALISGLEVARGLPWLMFGLLGGVVADRLDRRRVMAAVDAGRCIAVGLLAIAVWRGDATVALIWVVAFLLGSGEVFFDNSAQSILPSLVDDPADRAGQRPVLRHRVGGSRPRWPGGRSGAVREGGVAAVRARLGFVPRRVADRLHALRAATGRGRGPAEDRRNRAPATRERGPTIRADLREGWTWLKGHHLLRSLLVIGCTYNFLVVGAEAINVVFVLRVLHASKAVFGLILTGSALGGIAAGLSADRVIKKLGPGGTILTTLAVAGVAGLTAGTTNNVIVFAASMAVAVACGTLANIVVLSLRQTLVPDELRGRVNSLYRVALATAAPLGALAAGQLAGLVSLRAPLLVMGAGTLLLAAAAVPVVNNRAIERARR